MNTLSLWMVGIFFIDADPLLDEDKKPGVAVSWKKIITAPYDWFYYCHNRIDLLYFGGTYHYKNP